MSGLPTHIKWALEKLPGKEHVSFGNFIRHFNLNDRNSASQAFALLIGSRLIRNDRWEKLQKAFQDFYDHHAERFWAEHEFQVCSEASATPSADDIASESCIIDSADQANEQLRAIPGELVSKASTSARQLAEDEFGLTTSTSCERKVDLSIRIHVENE
ncbi:hypothetical protein BGX30_014907 [Mortierella sp. GBA39]|nr:hypothetical protein BGX30_014907 [Mortierella sp. GBA39]